jgi:hypothetical protein
MFWDVSILGHKAWLSGYWKLAFCTHRERLTRKELSWVRQHEHILRAIAFIMAPPAPLALRTSAILLTGVARSHKLECTSLQEAVARLDQQVRASGAQRFANRGKGGKGWGVSKCAYI